MEPDDLIVGPGVIALEGYVSDNDDVRFFEEGGAFCPRQLRGALAQMQGDVTVWVNSPGGSPAAGEAMRALLQGHSGQVRVVVAGMAASAASLLIMGAHRIEMTAGSAIMVHDPHSVAFGNADALRREAEALDALADVYACIYAARSEMTVEEMREIMRAETWYGPAAAIEIGFADAEHDAPGPEGLGMLASVPSQRAMQTKVAAMCRNEIFRRAVETTAGDGQSPRVIMAATGGSNMDPEETAVDTATPNAAGQTAAQTPNAPQVSDSSPEPASQPQMSIDSIRTAERTRVQRIMAAARPHMAGGAFDQTFVDGLIESGVSYETASAQMLDRLAAAQPDINMASQSRQAARVNRDERETRREGLTMALMARISGDAPEDDRARPFMEMSLHEMAAHAMGRSAPGMGNFDSRDRLLMEAFHTGSDFPNILSTSVNRILEQQYELTGRTFTEISREMSFNDFRAHDVVRPDEFPSLTKVNETGEIQFGKMGDSKETVALASYATGLSVSRQALVNDDLGALQDVLDSAGAIVPEFEESTFWALYLSNPALSDGTAVYHADHGNLASSGSAISVAAISAGRQALRQMKAADGKRVISMNAPSILLVGPAQETAAEQFINQTIQPGKAADSNPFAGKLKIVVTEAITNNRWDLLVAPSKRTVNFRHGHLRDRAMPRVRVAEPFGQQGLKMTLEHDFGVGAVNHRGGYSNPGT